MSSLLGSFPCVNRRCGSVLDVHAPVGEAPEVAAATVDAAAATICAECGTLMIVMRSGRPREPTAEERTALESSEPVRAARHELRRRRLQPPV